MNVRIDTAESMEVAAPSRPYGLLLNRAGIEAYADMQCLPEHRAAKIEQMLAVPRYSDGSARPHLWFWRKRDAEQVRTWLIARAGQIDAAKHQHR